MGGTMWGAAFLTVSSLLLLPAHTYAAPSLSGDDLDVFRKTEDWQLGPGTQQGPPLSLAKKVYLRAFLKEMKKISDMITSPKWTLQKGPEEPRLNRRGLQTEGLNLSKFNSMTVDAEESPLPPSQLVVRPSQSLIRSPFGVFRLRPQDPYWMDMMRQVGNRSEIFDAQ